MKHKILKKLLLLFLLLLAVGICFPVVFLIVGSLMGPDELNHYLGAVLGKTDGFASWALLPTYPTFKAYVQLLLDSPEFFVMFWNSVKMTGIILIGQVLTGVPAAWGFARLDIPDTSKVLLQSYLTHRPILTSNDFSDVLAAQLLDVHTDLTEYVDISSDLANRIDSFRYQFLSTEQFITLLSARNLTSTRIARCLFHIILDHRRNYLDTWRNHQYAGFLRILGFKKQSGAIWKFFQPSVRAQLITQTSQAYDHLTGIGLDIYNADLHASRLYRQILKCRSQSFLPDITSEPVIILP